MRNLYLNFDKHRYEFNVPPTLRATNGVEKEVNVLQQELPSAKELENLLTNDKDKFKLLTLLVKYISGKRCNIVHVHQESFKMLFGRFG